MRRQFVNVSKWGARICQKILERLGAWDCEMVQLGGRTTISSCQSWELRSQRQKRDPKKENRNEMTLTFWIMTQRQLKFHTNSKEKCQYSRARYPAEHSGMHRRKPTPRAELLSSLMTEIRQQQQQQEMEQQQLSSDWSGEDEGTIVGNSSVQVRVAGHQLKS